MRAPREFKKNIHWLEPIGFIEYKDPESIEKVIDGVGSDVDVFLTSLYSWNSKIQLAAAKAARKKWPNALIITGGPNVPTDATAFFESHPYIDIAVHGEGEVPLAEILSAKLSQLSFAEIDCISIRNEKSGHAQKYKELPKLQSPYIKGYFDRFINQVRAMGKEPWFLWETQRGCPYQCTFCDWGSATLSKIRPFSTEYVKSEIDWMAENKIKNIRSTDANFGILPRDLEITKYLCETKAKQGYPGELWVTWAKGGSRRVLEIAHMLNAHRFLMGGLGFSIQTTDPAETKAMRRKNITLDRFADFLENCNSKECPTYTDLLIGVALQTRQSFRKSIYDMIEAGLHETIKVHHCELLPSSEMASQEYIDRYSIETVPVSYYNAGWGIFSDKENLSVSYRVRSTSTASESDIADMLAFYDIMRILHFSGILRFVAIYLRRENAVPYSVFYEQLLDYFLQVEQGNTRLAKILKSLWEEKAAIFQGTGDAPKHGELWAFRRFYYLNQMQTVQCSVFLGHYLDACLHIDEIFAEVKDFVENTYLVDSEVIKELLSFQKHMLILPDYESKKGRPVRFAYNFYAYFRFYQKNFSPLEKRPIRLTFTADVVGTGNGKKSMSVRSGSFWRQYAITQV